MTGTGPGSLVELSAVPRFATCLPISDEFLEPNADLRGVDESRGRGGGGGLSRVVLRRQFRPSVSDGKTGPKKADCPVDEVCEELNNVALRHGIEDVADVVVRALPDQIVRPP